jgi:site-specific DNA recombinase
MTPPTYCIIHCRVSTARQAREGDSLETHADICRALAERNGWKLAHEPWLEAHTGSASIRPVFDDVLAFLDQNPGMVRYYLFRSIDRFTRGGVDLYNSMKRELRKRGVEPVDSMGIIQPGKNTLEHLGFEYEWSRTDPSEISELVVATQAKTEKTTILTRMIGQGISLAQKGYCVRQAADGYKLQRVFVDGKRRYIQVADPDRARFFIAMLELRAAGDLSDPEIVARVNAMGYRSRPFERWSADKTQVIGHGGGVLLTDKRLQFIVRNPIYCGVVCEKWTHGKPIRAPYPGLVSIETYNAANRGKRFIREQRGELELLYDYYPHRQSRVYSRANPQFPFKNVVMCPVCHKPFHASASRGKSGRRFPAYHCQRAHQRIGIDKASFEGIVSRFVSRLRFDVDLREAVIQASYDRYHERQGELIETHAAIRRTASGLEAQKAEAVKAFMAASSDAMRKALEAEVDRLEVEKTGTGCQLAATGRLQGGFGQLPRRRARNFGTPPKIARKPSKYAGAAGSISAGFWRISHHHRIRLWNTQTDAYFQGMFRPR